ncbi:Mutator MutT protein (7,8-dihydro-8-oxoguanine-triphosphatase) / Thiazole tautomerase TenI-like domain [hydrothermal vent metagenome]|uniref:Mutator MutT protein (7,8-dihydro-8-oxoguanine-triphosphatase) / Thiazole tautomerase TenI-like domain n=1 Tax=hydrothermal vent metagenome TaxID=652676 RepID=A0A3B1AS05_9ZZZZ
MQTEIKNLHALPECYLITGADPADKEGFLSQLEISLDSGINLVQLRAKSLPDIEFQSLAEDVLRVCRQHRVRCLLNASPELVIGLGADGVHLTGQQLQSVHQRPLSSEYLVGASCHTAADLTQAMELGLDFAVLSPVLVTSSHPQSQSLGWSRFAELVIEAGLPVYALGGMRLDMIVEAQNNGAQGVAGISGFWG